MHRYKPADVKSSVHAIFITCIVGQYKVKHASMYRQQTLSLVNVYFLQMSAQNWIQIALLGLLIVHNGASQTCSTPFDAVFAGVTDVTLPDSVLVLADPQMTFYRDLVGFK